METFHIRISSIKFTAIRNNLSFATLNHERLLENEGKRKDSIGKLLKNL